MCRCAIDAGEAGGGLGSAALRALHAAARRGRCRAPGHRASCASLGAIWPTAEQTCCAAGSATAAGRFAPPKGRFVLDQLIVSQLARGVSPPTARVACPERACARAGAEHAPCAGRASWTAPRPCGSRSRARLRIEPRLLVIDEPTMGVDLLDRDEILLLLRSLADEGIAVLASTGTATGLSRAPIARCRSSDGELHGHAAPPSLPRWSRCVVRPAGRQARERRATRAGEGSVSLLELEEVVKHYHGAGEEVRAVDGVSLAARTGRDGRAAWARAARARPRCCC